MLSAAFSAFAAPAPPAWRTTGDNNVAALVFGSVDAMDTTFALICDNAQKTAEVTVHEANKRARRGQPVTIELSAAETNMVLKGTIATDNGVYGYAKRIDYKSILGLLRGDQPITVRMNGNTHILPEKGRAGELQQFTRICKLK
jgi:hypothetical protein